VTLARGNGYLKDYDEVEVAAALTAEDAGRPIVRVGAEDAAKSVGRHHSQRKNAASAETAEENLNDDDEVAGIIDGSREIVETKLGQGRSVRIGQRARGLVSILR
jgi:hypothetical protein